MVGSKDRRINEYMKKHLTRRQAIKAGGIAAIGLAFSKPVIETLRPPPAWAQVSPGIPIPPGPGPVSPGILQAVAAGTVLAKRGY